MALDPIFPLYCEFLKSWQIKTISPVNNIAIEIDEYAWISIYSCDWTVFSYEVPCFVEQRFEHGIVLCTYFAFANLCSSETTSLWGLASVRPNLDTPNKNKLTWQSLISVKHFCTVWTVQKRPSWLNSTPNHFSVPFKRIQCNHPNESSQSIKRIISRNIVPN